MTETLRTVDGRQVLRIDRQLVHPPAKVWRAITDPAELGRWFPFEVAALDLRVGGAIRFVQGGTTVEARVTELDPPRLFAFSSRNPLERESEDLLRFELRPEGGACRLLFTHVFDDRHAAASYATGWHACLDALDLLLDGKPVEDLAPSAWVDKHEAYVRAFGLDQGTAEETPDGWRLRYERQLMGSPVDVVWAALTGAAPAGQDADAKGVPLAGSAVDLAVGDPAPPVATTAAAPAGEVTAVETPSLLEYCWPDGDRVAGRVRWELAEGPGGARVVVTQTGPSELAGGRAGALAAWRDRVEGLARRLAAASGQAQAAG